jgi:hypothetical protein
MLISKIEVSFLFVCVILTIFIASVSATDYSVGVIPGRYVKYGNFVVSGSMGQFFDLDWMKYEVAAVSGKSVLLLQTGISRNDTTMPFNGSMYSYDVEKGTVDGTPTDIPPIIAANLSQGDRIGGFGYNLTRTENRTYFGLNRTVNVLETSIISGNTTIRVTMVWDKITGLALERQMEQTDIVTGTTTVSYSVTETNIFTGEPIPELPSLFALSIIMTATAIEIMFYKKRQLNS